MLTATKIQTGLCSTCVLVDGCAFPKTPKQPKIFCEEFDGGLSNGHKKDVDPNVIMAHVNIKPKGRVKTFNGLCVNCEIRESCTFPKAEGGIWHCEEYR